MRVTVVYDSFFGNTEKVAKRISDALKQVQCEVKLIQIDQFHPDEVGEVDLLIIGSPTRAFEPTKKIVNVLKSLHKDRNPKLKVAIFDTRIDIAEVNNKILNIFVKWRGYANDTMKKILDKKGIPVVSKPGEFYVADSEGPLKDGEFEKADAWVKDVLKNYQNNFV